MMATVGNCATTAAAASSSGSRLIPEDTQRRVTKHQRPHHPQPHFRPTTKPSERQRKIKRNQRINFVSTDGTTSGGTSDCNSEDFQLNSNNECGGGDISIRLEQFMKKPENSDLEADCEDNNSTDVDTVSISGSIKHKNPIEGNENVLNDSKMELLNAKIRNLEKQLATVLSLNIKLKEENDRLKSVAAFDKN
uniref:Uncharacterized protein n=1 Tax=Panagrolaimus superbus TaxID=310955 RepID=A0A914Z9E7_9BILA